MARELLQPHRFYCYYYKVLQVSTMDHFITLPPAATATDTTNFMFSPYLDQQQTWYILFIGDQCEELC